MAVFKKILVAAALLAAASAVHASEATKAIVTSYVQIQTALAADKTAGVKPAAEAIAKQAESLGVAGQPIVKAAKAVAAARNLNAARDAFGPLSDAVIAAAKADGWKDLSGVSIGFCPMVNRSWIQKDGAVKNPYYGSQMLTCGDLKDPKKPK
jgi:hypothetical protein